MCLTFARRFRAQNASGGAEQRFQIDGIDRLHQVTVEASFRRTTAIRLLAISGDGNQEEVILAILTAQLLGPTSPLNADQIRYLDFLGNNNGSFDVGDFLAWVKATGAPLSAAAQQAPQRKGGPR